MPGGGGPDVPEETTQIVKNVPYLSGEINYGASEARSLYDSLLGGYRTRDQIYNDLKGQYTTQGPSIYGGTWFNPDGVAVSTEAALNAAYAGKANPMGIASQNTDEFNANYLERMGYTRGSASGPSTTDYDALNAAVDAELANQGDGYQYYPNSTVVPFSQATEDALSGIEARARAGSDLNRSAQQLTQDTLDGKYLNSNPYLDDVVNYATNDITDRYLNQIMPQLNSTFAQSGRFGSGAQAMALGDATGEYLDSVGKTSSDIRYRNYADERARQGQYAALAPSMAELDYNDYSRLAGVGSAREELDRAYLQEDIDRFYFNQDAPGALLDQYINRVTQLNGSFGTQTGTSTNPAAYAASGGGGLTGAIGGAATGLGLASQLGLLGGGGLSAGAAGLAAGGSLIPGAAFSGAAGAGAGMLGALGPVGLGIGVLGGLAGAFG